MMTDRVPDLDEIQGNILGGFNTDIQVLVGLSVATPSDFQRAAQWLAGQSSRVTVAADVKAQRELIKAATPDPANTWLCIAVSQRLLKAACPDVLIRDDAFNGGMQKRAPSILSDKTDPKGWRAGPPQTPIDVLLVIGANNEIATSSRASDLIADAAANGLVANYHETARRIASREHFGFKDGISQPTVSGFDSEGKFGLGHFVFGYPKAPDLEPFWPVSDDRRVTDNGSLLVFRRLAQDVIAFRTFCENESARLAPQWPGLSADHLGALIVGRWPSGAPIKASQASDPGGEHDENDFDFSDDPNARSCPFGAHIRKVNPRNGPKDVVETPRMLRRGIPFGPTLEADPEAPERGLAFISFQSSIKGQFEFLTQHWMNSDTLPAYGSDLLVGRAQSTRSLDVIGPNGPLTIQAPEPGWIKPTGGAYLFAPSRTGLAKLAEPPPKVGFWKAKHLFVNFIDAAKGMLE